MSENIDYLLLSEIVEKMQTDYPALVEIAKSEEYQLSYSNEFLTSWYHLSKEKAWTTPPSTEESNDESLQKIKTNKSSAVSFFAKDGEQLTTNKQSDMQRSIDEAQNQSMPPPYGYIKSLFDNQTVIVCPRGFEFTPQVSIGSLGNTVQVLNGQGLLIVWEQSLASVFQSYRQTFVNIKWCIENLNSPCIYYFFNPTGFIRSPPNSIMALLAFEDTVFTTTPHRPDEEKELALDTLHLCHRKLSEHPAWFHSHLVYKRFHQMIIREYTQWKLDDSQPGPLTPLHKKEWDKRLEALETSK